MPNLSVIIPGRNEWLFKDTVEDILKNIRGDTEILAVLDGAWCDPPLQDHPRLNVIHYTESIGQRAATNAGARLSRSKYLMKLDAHCIMDEGFDVKLIADADKDTVVTPRLYILHAFDRVCNKCGERVYQGPTDKPCEKSQGIQWTREMVWQPRLNRRSDFYRFDKKMQFQYWREYEKRKEAKADIADCMSILGACWFIPRKLSRDLGHLDEKHGSWGQVGTEVACKTWLSGHRLVVNKKTLFSHKFRTQGGDFGFPYPISGQAQDRAKQYSPDLWMNNKWPLQKHKLEWLIEKFKPVPEWHN